VAVISTLFGQFFGEQVIERIRYGKTSKSLLEQEWVREQFGQDGLTVETPFKLNPFQLPFPENVQAIIDDCSGYMIETKEGMMIMVIITRYRPQVGTIDLQGAANGTIAEMKMQPGVTGFEYTEDYTYKGEFPAYIQKGTFNQGKVKMGFINTGMVNGLVYYQVMAGYREEDRTAAKMAERIMGSVTIKANPARI
jgi:hypothetical protein